MEMLQNSIYFGVVISLTSYGLGVWLKKKFKLAIFNPLLIAVVITIGVLLIFKIEYGVYEKGMKVIGFFLTPATVCLAVPLYEQWEVLKANKGAVLLGCLTGVITSAVVILVLAIIFNIGHTQYITLLPKSITTAIGMDLSTELGGYPSLTVAAIVITGILGNVIGGFVLKLFRITEPVAEGIALGSASHVIGTAKAMELGDVQGAMGSLSIVVSGILTVIFANIFAYIY